MATHEEVLEVLGAMKARVDEPDLQKQMGEFTKSVQFDCTDLGVSLLVEFRDGVAISLEENAIDSPDILVTTDSDTLVGIGTGQINALSAFMSGKLQVNAALPDLLKLQRLMQ